MSFSFLKKRWFWITAVIVVLVGGWYYHSKQANKGPFFDSSPVTRGTLLQTVDVTGEIKPDARIGLSFKSTGRIAGINVKIGQTVKKGDVLAQLDAQDTQLSIARAAAALSLAQANLNAKLAGETKESIRIAQASVDQAQAALDKSNSDLDITKQQVANDYQVALINFQTAQKNLNSAKASSGQSVTSTYSTLKATLLGSLGAMRAGLVDGDNIIGVDDSASNDSYESVLSLTDRGAIESARTQYQIAKPDVVAAETAVRALTENSSHEAILSAADKARTALNEVQSYLDMVKRALSASVTNAYLTDSVLTTKKAGIDSDRATVSTQLSAVVSGEEGAKGTGITQQNSVDQAQSAFDTAQTNLSVADSNRTLKVQSAQTNVAVQEAALSSAKANLASHTASPRDVDVAGLRAQVAEAQASFAQAQLALQDVQIIAPEDGIITDIGPAIGEQASPSVAAVSMIGTEQYTIESLVPESDIAKVKVGQPVSITLDAFGDDVKFTGSVLAENPDQTKVQDAIYYKVYATIDAGERDIKPGMTANLTIETAKKENVLIIPSRAIRDQDGQKSVRILVGTSETKDANVTVGLRGNEGTIEITSGLEEGQKIVTGELTAAEYAAKQAEAAATH